MSAVGARIVGGPRHGEVVGVQGEFLYEVVPRPVLWSSEQAPSFNPADQRTRRYRLERATRHAEVYSYVAQVTDIRDWPDWPDWLDELSAWVQR